MVDELRAQHARWKERTERQGAAARWRERAGAEMERRARRGFRAIARTGSACAASVRRWVRALWDQGWGPRASFCLVCFLKFATYAFACTIVLFALFSVGATVRCAIEATWAFVQSTGLGGALIVAQVACVVLVFLVY
jgi:hypothetical protein